MSAVLDKDAVPKQTSLTELRRPPAPEANMPAVNAGFFDLQSFELMQRIAKGFASSSLVPKEYVGNVANCMIALNLARRINGDPLMVMQSLTIVHGRPTWASQFLIATANMCGRFSALRFEFFGTKGGDDWGCRAWAIEKATGEKLIGSDITIALAKKEGWHGRNGSKWQSMPQQMLMYRAGAWWVRAYAPELSMGLMAADEAGDIYDANPDADGGYSVSTEDLRNVDKDTGEITGDAGVPTVNYDAIKKQLTEATDAEVLDIAADTIGGLADSAQQDELRELYRDRKTALAQAAGKKK